MKEPESILVYGLGLMGGSLALSIRKAYPKVKLVGVVQSEKSREEGIRLQIAETLFTEEDFWKQFTFSNFSFVIFGLPVTKLVELIPRAALCNETIFTDLGSTKLSIIKAVDESLGTNHSYISSHPMCGSEESGLAKSIPNLYQDKLTFVSSCKNSKPEALSFVKEFWKKMGSWVLEVEPELHDEVLAYVSHLPHIVSSLLVNTSIQNERVSGLVGSSDKPITGGGFRDMSRIAGSNWEMWKSIFQENRESILNSLLSFQSNLNDTIQMFQNWSEKDIQTLHKLWNQSLIAKNQINKKP